MRTYFALLFLSIAIGYNSFAQTNGVSEFSSDQTNFFSNSLDCDTIASFPLQDTWPTGVGWDGTHLWCTGSDSDFIYKFQPDGLLISRIPSPSDDYGTQGIFFDDDELWTLSENKAIIYHLDKNTGVVLDQINLPSSDSYWGLAFDGTYIYATDYLNSLMYKIEKSNKQIVDTFSTSEGILGLEFINGELFGLSSSFERIHRMSPTDGTLKDTLDWCIPYPLGLVWDGTDVWNVSSSKQYDGNQRLYKIDWASFTSTNDVTQDFSSGLFVTPNPFSESGVVSFTTPKSEIVLVELFSSMGEKLETLYEDYSNSGENTLPIILDRSSVGTYFIKLTTSRGSEAYKFIICP